MIEKKISWGQIIAIAIMLGGLVTSYAIFGQDAVYAKSKVDVLEPIVTRNAMHVTTVPHMTYKDAVKEFPTRAEWVKGEVATQEQLKVISEDIKLILQRLPK